MANGEMAIVKKIATFLGILIGVITILTSGYYFVSDRFAVVAQVNRNTESISDINIEIDKLEVEVREGAAQRNRKIDDLIFNQKRMMERLGIIWKPFKDDEK